MTYDWHIFKADQPVRCPNRRPGGRSCNRAQDRVAPGTMVRVRIQGHPSRALAGSLLRICRSCKAKLELNVAKLA